MLTSTYKASAESWSPFFPQFEHMQVAITISVIDCNNAQNFVTMWWMDCCTWRNENLQHIQKIKNERKKLGPCKSPFDFSDCHPRFQPATYGLTKGAWKNSALFSILAVIMLLPSFISNACGMGVRLPKSTLKTSIFHFWRLYKDTTAASIFPS
mgnify:CR=1 FL=1